MTEYQGYACAPGEVGRIAIIVSKFNRAITDRLLEGALSKLREHQTPEDQIDVIRVPGAFEIPVVAERFACDDEYAAVICLGCVIKGETPHDEYINSAVSQQLASISVSYCVPVVFGILTCTTVEQALARSGATEVGRDKTLGEQPGNKGSEAAEVALEMIDLFGRLPELEIGEETYDSLEANAKRYHAGDFETVDVDPNELIDLDEAEVGEDADGDMSWLVKGGGYKKDKQFGRRDDDRRAGRSSERSDKFSKPRQGKGFESGDKRFKKHGDKKRKK